jgi:uncharacterized SAM-binding protein YcdF (DUF218 family)
VTATTPWCPACIERAAVLRAGLTIAAVAAALAPSTAVAGEAIVVLGAGVRPDGTLGVRTTARLEAALELSRRLPGAAIVVSGGAVTSTRPEGPAMADWLAARGVARARIAVEERARHTGENADLVVPILRRLGVDRAVLVTDRHHLARARYHMRAALREQGVALDVRGLAVPDGLHGRRRVARGLLERGKILRDRFLRARNRARAVRPARR